MTTRSPSTLTIAFGLALGAAVSLGLARFSYALLLPPMRADLDWSYLTAGAMNTANAAGYLAGALLAPRWLARHDARAVMLAGMVASALMLIAHGLVLGDAPLYVLRLLTGVGSAATFVAGGLLAARLAHAPVAAGAKPVPPGLVLGLYYGGTGLGIIASSLLVPPLATRAVPHAWQSAWWALGLAALVAGAITLSTVRAFASPPVPRSVRGGFRWRDFGFGLAAYLMFGLGYIGYMTFIITLLHEQQVAPEQIVGFFVLLGAGVVASSWIWAGVLQRFRGGESLALLNGLLAVATMLPVLSVHPLALVASGVLFGAVFLSLVASTTALVRHNLPADAWPAGIAAFTIVFAAGQIAGPTIVGWLADGSGGLSRGLAYSALFLAAGAVLAMRQKPLHRVH